MLKATAMKPSSARSVECWSSGMWFTAIVRACTDHSTAPARVKPAGPDR